MPTIEQLNAQKAVAEKRVERAASVVAKARRECQEIDRAIYHEQLRAFTGEEVRVACRNYFGKYPWIDDAVGKPVVVRRRNDRHIPRHACASVLADAAAGTTTAARSPPMARFFRMGSREVDEVADFADFSRTEQINDPETVPPHFPRSK